VITKIVSGGQTGADRAALDFAIENRISHGGWCPKGRLAEDGVIPAKYHLTETPSPDSAQRTEWNVRDSDGTVIFSIRAELKGGSTQTEEFAILHRKPCIHLSQERDGETTPAKLSEFLRKHTVERLNIAGPRASEEEHIQSYVTETLSQIRHEFFQRAS
jgi:hypothetical protein